jgi:hypothetical protein
MSPAAASLASLQHGSTRFVAKIIVVCSNVRHRLQQRPPPPTASSTSLQHDIARFVATAVAVCSNH